MFLQQEGKEAAQQQGVTAAEVMTALGPPLPPVACNDAELADARWFSRAWLAAVLSGAELASWLVHLCLRCFGRGWVPAVLSVYTIAVMFYVVMCAPISLRTESALRK